MPCVIVEVGQYSQLFTVYTPFNGKLLVHVNETHH